MSDSCNSVQLYQSKLNQQISNSNTSLIIICLFLPLQFLFMVLIFIKGHKKYRKLVLKRQSQFLNKNLQLKTHNDIKNKMINPQKELENEEIKQKQGALSMFLFGHSSRLKIFIFILIYLIFIGICFIFLLMTVLATYQAVNNNISYAQCKLNNKLNEFVVGSQNWIGLQKLIPNITQLNLILNTRIQVSINAIKGLVLNGTVAAIKPGLGFANNTNIVVINQQSPLSLTNLTYNTIKTNINASVRYWLFMNTSLSGAFKFPVCQNGQAFPIQHPVNTGQTVQLNYMDDICSKLVKQVDDLVQNGNKVDQLLVKLEEIKLIKSNIQSNLSTLNSTYSPISSRSKEYSLQLSTIGFQSQYAYYLPIIGFAGYSIIGGFIIVYFLFSFCLACCNCCNCDWQDQNGSSQNQSVQRNMNRQKYKQAYSQVSLKYTRIFLISMLLINILVGISAYLYSKSSIQYQQICRDFQKSLTNSQYFNSLSLKQNQKQLLTPIQDCASGKNTYFMQNIPLTTSRSSLQKMYYVSQTYNDSVPKNVFQVQSLKQVEVLKQYLFHLQTMPIKSTSFNLIQILKDVNQYSNGSHLSSKQIAECSKAVIQDEYVYNSVDCKNKLMDLLNELTTTEPRCIILPTYDGTPGTSTTHLNEAQHTFVLGGACASINNMFSPGNASCYLAKRLALLSAQGCTSTASQLGTKLQNLVKFSQQASTFTDVYMQNLRNFFGVYAVSSTNLTQFFVGTNMSQTLGQFGVLSHNLLNRTKCEDINSKVQDVYNSFCPYQNSSSVLLSQAYIWTIIVVIMTFLQSILFYVIDIFLRVYRLNRFFDKVGEQDYGKKIRPMHDQRNGIQVSQQTLIRNNIFNDFEGANQGILDNQIQQQHSNHKIFTLQQQKYKEFDQIKRSLQNDKSFDDTNDMIFQKGVSSPVKSRNPYGNYQYSDQVIQYPHFEQSAKKPRLGSIVQAKSESQQPNFQIQLQKSSNRDLNPQLNRSINPNQRSINPALDEDSSQSQESQNNDQQISGKYTPKLNIKSQIKVSMPSTTKRLKKINFKDDQKQIVPQLIFNLDQIKDQKHLKQNDKKVQIRTPRYNIGSISDNQSGNQQKQKVKPHTGRQKVQKPKQSQNVSKSKNYLQINLNQDEFLKESQRQIQQVKFNQEKGDRRRKKKNKESVQKIKSSQNKTAR